jgi:hypothetical protein
MLEAQNIVGTARERRTALLSRRHVEASVMLGQWDQNFFRSTAGRKSPVEVGPSPAVSRRGKITTLLRQKMTIPQILDPVRIPISRL